MKCPKCGQELRPSKKDPDYMLCFDCKKKYKISKKEEKRTRDVEEEQAYSNIPPKKVREKREKEMRKAYDEMLSVEEKPRRKKRRDEMEYEEEKVSKAPVIILGIAILIVAALIVYMLMR